jgi:hypothetical protein
VITPLDDPIYLLLAYIYGVGLTTRPWKKNVTKSEEAKAGRTILRRNGGDG